MNTDQAAPADSSQTHVLLGPNGDLLAEVAAPERLNRIQALLAQWMRMENVVVLLGAGASVHQGGPLMGQLEEFVLNGATEIITDHHDLTPCLPVLRARLQERKTSAYWFEQWLSFLTNATHIASSSNSPIVSLRLRGITDSGKEETCDLSTEQLTQLLLLLGQLIYLRCSLNLPALDGETSPSGHHSFAAKLVASLDSHNPPSAKGLPTESSVFSGFLQKRYRWMLYLYDMFPLDHRSKGGIHKFGFHAKKPWFLRGIRGFLPGWAEARFRHGRWLTPWREHFM